MNGLLIPPRYNQYIICIYLNPSIKISVIKSSTREYPTKLDKPRLRTKFNSVNLVPSWIEYFFIRSAGIEFDDLLQNFCENFLRESLPDFQRPIFCAVELFENMIFKNFRPAFLNSFSFIKWISQFETSTSVPQGNPSRHKVFAIFIWSKSHPSG